MLTRRDLFTGLFGVGAGLTVPRRRSKKGIEPVKERVTTILAGPGIKLRRVKLGAQIEVDVEYLRAMLNDQQ